MQKRPTAGSIRGFCRWCCVLVLIGAGNSMAQDQQPQVPDQQTNPTAGDNPSTQPGVPGPGRRMGSGMGGPWQGGGFNREEREALNAFMREHMPNLYRVCDGLPRSPLLRRLRTFASNRMHSLDQFKNDDALTARMLKNIETEDQLFVFVQDLDKANTEQQRVAAREKMRQKIKEIVDGFLIERAERIEKLKSRVADEERKLKEDQANRDQLVDRRVKQFLREFTREDVPDDSPDQPAASTQPAGNSINAFPDAGTKK